MFEFTLACKAKGQYVCPPDAGPAWRAAYEAGYDMAELETNLRLTHGERLMKHDRLRNEWIEFEELMAMLRRGSNLLHNWRSGRENRQSKI